MFGISAINTMICELVSQRCLSTALSGEIPDQRAFLKVGGVTVDDGLWVPWIPTWVLGTSKISHIMYGHTKKWSHENSPTHKIALHKNDEKCFREIPVSPCYLSIWL